MNHDELVKRAEKWLKNSKKCGVVMIEWYGGPRETPDAIGWYGREEGILIECKSSYEDFKADSRKYFRKTPGRGMGKFRYYMAPPGIIPLDELPPKWGLLEVHEKMVKNVKKAQEFELGIASLKNERKIMINALRAVICSTQKDLSQFRICNDPNYEGKRRKKKRR